jgi:hypothetical protein
VQTQGLPLVTFNDVFRTEGLYILPSGSSFYLFGADVLTVDNSHHLLRVKGSLTILRQQWNSFGEWSPQLLRLPFLQSENSLTYLSFSRKVVSYREGDVLKKVIVTLLYDGGFLYDNNGAKFEFQDSSTKILLFSSNI